MIISDKEAVEFSEMRVCSNSNFVLATEMFTLDNALRGVRHNNEDCIGSVVTPSGVLVVMVADGLGGHANGEEASFDTVTLMCKELSETYLTPENYQQELTSIVLLCKNHLINNRRRDNRDTTLALVAVFDNQLIGMNIGDSTFELEQDEVIIKSVPQQAPWGALTNTMATVERTSIQWKRLELQTNRIFHAFLSTDGLDELMKQQPVVRFEQLKIPYTAENLCKQATLFSTDNCSCILVKGVPAPPTDPLASSDQRPDTVITSEG